MMAIINKNELIRYLMYVHKRDNNFDISRIKLQKSLYFLYAFWIKTKSDATKEQNEISDLMSNMCDELFEASFFAWSYGPVDKGVYSAHRTNQLKEFSVDEANAFEESVSENPIIMEFLNTMIKRIFATSDFGLVDLSHKDSAWVRAFENSENKIITHKDIVKDYAVE